MTADLIAGLGIKLMPSFPYRDLDGTPFPNCDHQHFTEDPVEIAVIRGFADTILAAGLPVPFVRVGDKIKTSWGCDRNKHLTHREAIVSIVGVALYRHPQSMWYRPAYEYFGMDSRHQAMVLHDMTRSDGATWRHDEMGEWSPISFRLEWISKNHGGVERFGPDLGTAENTE